ncbi:TlpA family protein disulfide reductase [Sphingobacterium sp. LRF_L2]|uniref:TlpA family protein disulfide reductase n=1 Tax=Sphingobacterium sp. LRF_L2 TaxID=3369421 RepID=UPI003F604565
MGTRFLIGLIGGLCFASLCYGQKLGIGDRLPDFLWKRDAVIVPDRYELTVLDFWSHSCGSCIASFPKINRLKELFGDRVNIVLVNSEPADSTDRLFDTRDWITRPSVPLISGNTAILESFAYFGLPFIVWLDRDLTVRAFSEGSQLQEDNIRSLLAGGSLKEGEYVSPRYVSSLFDTEYEDNLEAFSMISRSQHRVTIGSAAGGGSLRQDIVVNRSSMEDLFRYAYQGDGRYDLLRKWHVHADSAIGGRINEDGHPILYDYAMKLSSRDRGNPFDRMKEDLERYFYVSATIDSVPLRTMVLVRSDKTLKLRSKGGKAKNTFRATPRIVSGTILGTSNRVLVNQPYEKFSRAVRNLVENNMELPFRDTVNFVGNVDVSFDYLVFDFFSVDMLQEALEGYGLKLEEQTVKQPVLMIRRK